MRGEIPNPSITPPDWSIQPSNIREIVGENGKPSFEFIIDPIRPENSIWRLDQVAYTISNRHPVHTTEISEKKDHLISQRKEQLDLKYRIALQTWKEEGQQGEPPPQPSFFDGQLVRLSPHEVYATYNINTGEPLLIIPLGRTSYFDYVATRDLDRNKYSESKMASPLGICGVLTARDKNYQEYMIYTVRTTKTESYQGFFHVVGGMLARPQWDMASPTGGWIKELGEEAGIKEGEVEVEGSLGLVLDTYWFHPEFTHKAKLSVPLEEIFDKDGVKLKSRRETDKEVELRAIPWDPNVVRALILGRKVKNGDQDLRPWVPTGLANLLFAGGIDFGETWFNKTLKAYRKKISLLRK
ncbi:MAG: hypothetical protein Q7K55_07515 [Candidatus Levybacteria bacterium]|nr:hypothetical protein [Candidatus Levybacteria bacterium]